MKYYPVATFTDSEFAIAEMAGHIRDRVTERGEIKSGEDPDNKSVLLGSNNPLKPDQESHLSISDVKNVELEPSMPQFTPPKSDYLVIRTLNKDKTSHNERICYEVRSIPISSITAIKRENDTDGSRYINVHFKSDQIEPYRLVIKDEGALEDLLEARCPEIGIEGNYEGITPRK